ncbi:MAG: molybdopterin molybdotransferase MoeA [Gammaproteobacteria bacterium]|nr:molybdopterin molybdotransferase MoeA [Gammaproteobacteria bacterium]
MDEYDPNSLPVEIAILSINTAVKPIAGFERVALRSALGRILATDVASHIDVPTHTNSAMDGYALASADIDTEEIVTLKVVGTSWAGRPYLEPVNSGECVRIMTGAVLPEGTDSVAIQEKVERVNDVVRVTGREVASGDNVRDAGEDIQSGAVAVARGCRIGPAQLGLLASLGVAEVDVVRRLRVAFFSTGDELRSVGETLDVGTIYDSNRYTLYGMLTELGAHVIDMGVVRDTREDVEAAFATAAACADAVITSGGVSVGDADFVKETLEKAGEVNFWKIAMKPGRPLAFGSVGNAVFFGLPGNPVSVMVTYYQFVQAALKRMMGETTEAPPRLRARTADTLKKRSGRMEFQRGILRRTAEGELQVSTTGAQGSGILTSMHEANCFVILAPESEGAAPGEWVDVEPFNGVVG